MTENSSGRRPGVLAAALMLITACGSPLEVEVPSALASLGCAPNDGPATAFQLSPGGGGEPPVLHVSIFGARTALQPGRWSVDGSEASASWCSGGACAPAGPGEVRLTRVEPDRIDGSVDVRVPGGRIVWRFAAAWIDDPVLCG
ncbi:MAG: hypothetical protein AB7S39_08155 [Gemmatimonadales bacterium]